MDRKNLKDIELKDLYFGNADGAREANNKNFNEYFYDKHTDYSLLKNNKNKFIISGKKGAGKTYLAKFLEKNVRKEKVLSKTIKWDDINLNILIEFGKLQKGSEYDAFYKFIMLIEMTRLIILCKIRKNINVFRNPVKFCKALIGKFKLRKFYNDRYPEGNYSIEKIKKQSNYSDKVDLMSVFQCANLHLEQSQGEEIELKRKNPFNIIEELETLVFNFAKYIPIVLISDDLDEQEMNMLSNKDFQEFLVRYLMVVDKMNLVLETTGSKCVVVIRNDILDKLNSLSSNINKLITDSTILVNWCQKMNRKPWEYDIAKMLINKIRVSAKLDSELTDKEIYLHFFGEKIEHSSQIEYLISRSLGRPRDIIVYLNKIIEKNGNARKFLASAYRNVLNEYSEYFINEFKNELSIFYNWEYIEHGFNLLSNYNKVKFDYKGIEKYYNENKEQYTAIPSLKNLITDFYNIGLLGNCYDDGAISFAYRPDGKNKVSFDFEFVVHYGACKKLITKK